MLFSINFCYALTTLHQTETETKISSGTTLKNYNLLTDDGWMNVNVLEIDLKDKYTKLGVLTSSDGAGKLKNILSMAQESGAIAGINGDFFAGSKGTGHSIGLSVNNSNFISSGAYDNSTKDTFASFILNEDNEPFLDYFTTNITLTSEKTKKSITSDTLNKYSNNYAIPAIYTSDWGEFSLGSSEGLVLTEMVVKNGKVTEIRYNEPAVEIPENGFVVSALGEGADFINSNFKKGYKVSLDISLFPDLDDIEFAISGGAKLLDDGVIPETFSHNISGRNPRTAIGINKKEDTVYLVTVDGRQAASIGMTQTEFAEFLKSIDIYNAINLDGGGSTTMVARNNGLSTLYTVNKVSDGALRSVINGVGVFSTAPESNKLYGLNIEISDTNIFNGEEREISVTGYNKYYNPVEVDLDDVDWDYEGVALKVKNGKVSGTTVGSSVLTASVGKIKASVEINILSDANELFISPKKSAMKPNGKIDYTIKAKNKNGYYATTDLSSIDIKIEEFYLDGVKQDSIPSDAKIEDYSFTANTAGDYVLSFTKGNIVSYALVGVASQKAVILDDFESQTFDFDEYPDEVIGNATLSSEQVYSGKKSVKLEYDFRQDIQIRGAYIELNEPLTIPKDANSLSFWVYNDEYKDEKLKIKIKDANNSTKLIVLQENISHEGWQEVIYNLSDVALPATISDIYLAQDDLSIKETGCIYVDKLAYYTNDSGYKFSNIRMPKDVKIEDQNNTSFNSEDSFNIALLDTLYEPNLLIENLRNTTLYNSINDNSNLTVFTENTNAELLKNINTEIIVNDSGYKLYDINSNSTLICIDISNGGIRLTDATQWNQLKQDIEDTDSDNIFIVLNSSIDTFDDLKERQFFVDELCELNRTSNKNILVLHTGYYTDYTMERGVKFLGVNTKNISAENIATDYSYILISVLKDKVSYEIKNIF